MTAYMYYYAFQALSEIHQRALVFELTTEIYNYLDDGLSFRKERFFMWYFAL